MAKCKYCHAAISRLDKEVCPFCGAKKPLEGTDTSTQDVTKVIDQLENAVPIKHRKRIVAAILTWVLGFLGAHHFYLGKVNKGIVNAIFSIIFIGGIGSLLFFVANLTNALAFLIPYFVVEALMIYVGIGYLTRHDITDSHGEFLD